MGRPAHYSRDITARCSSLLRHLMPRVREGLPDDAKFEGKLTTTFLIALATPMVVLPVERIYKPSAGIGGVADDRAIHEGLRDDVKKVFDGKTKFVDAPFFIGDWRYAPNRNPFNIADAWPGELLDALDDKAAVRTAEDAPARTIMVHLRNALAHGGITYLDRDGRQSLGPAAMLGLISAKMKDGKIVGLHALRVSAADFEEFITAWSEWIEASGVAAALSDERDLAA